MGYMGYAGFGAAAQEQALVSQFNAKIDQGRALINDMRRRLNEEKCTFAKKAVPVFGVKRAFDCGEQFSILSQASSNLTKLQQVTLQPGLAPSDPPDTPVIFVRPQDVAEAAANIINSIKQQLKTVAQFEESTPLSTAVDALTKAFVEVIGFMSESAGEAAGKAAKKALDKAREGGFPVFTVAAVASVVAAAWVWRSFK